MKPTNRNPKRLTKVQRRRAIRDSLRRASRAIPRMVEEEPDRIEAAIWTARRSRFFRRLYEHPKFVEIFGYLRRGVPVTRVARWLQQSVPPSDPLGSGTMNAKALERTLYRFRSLLPEGTIDSTAFMKQFILLGESVDVLEEMDALIRYQRWRIEQKAESERDFPVPLEAIGKEVDRLREALAARATIQQVLLGKVPGTAQITQQFLTVSPQEDDLDRLMREQPERIPEVMSLIDQMDKILSNSPKQVGSGPGTDVADGPQAAAAG